LLTTEEDVKYYFKEYFLEEGVLKLIEFEIPGFKKFTIENIVLDYNGTLAFHGQLIEGIEEKLKFLSKKANIHILTADTFGCVKEEIKNETLNIVVLDKKTKGSENKRNFIKSLDAERTAAVGNGSNDAAMLKTAAIGIAVMGKEGVSKKCLTNSDLLVSDIHNALDLLINVKSLIATLRK